MENHSRRVDLSPVNIERIELKDFGLLAVLADDLHQHVAHICAVQRLEADVQASTVGGCAENIDDAVRAATRLDERVVGVVER